MPDQDKNSYVKIVELLRSHFESQHFRSLARQQLSDCKQSQSESARDFAERVKKLKPTLRFHVKAANPATFDDAVPVSRQYQLSTFSHLCEKHQELPGGTNHRGMTTGTGSLPPANLYPPRQQQQFPIRNDFQQSRPYNQNPRESAGYGRTRPQQGTVPQQRNDRRNSSNVLAVEQASTPDATNFAELPTMQQKDAHIAALIERNNALADLAFATRDLNIQDEPVEHSPRGYSSSKGNGVRLPWIFNNREFDRTTRRMSVQGRIMHYQNRSCDNRGTGETRKLQVRFIFPYERHSCGQG
ncbi:hypothetical protein ANCCAN_11249 [Ancylostoma caninum]|uniref:Retrotransposon gag domain-containing protein n=1 Tax=Ancylostoma caninum TaxID=29170 RepID=A0A368GEF1_ANCCA|nr:hypothetical protein ANCCAN_11249 [Ancylostoma caninum]